MNEASEIFDPEALARYAHGDREFEREALELFLDTARTLLAGLRASPEDFPAHLRAAHTLKGNARTIGASRLARSAERMEREVRTGGAELDGRRAEVEEQFQELLRHLGRGS